MMRLLGIAICVLLPSICFSQEAVFVRAGEHPTYSRLVIQLAPDRPWEFRTSGRRAVLSLPDSAVEFDIAEVFDRIPKTRILSLRSVRTGQNSDLVMTFGCACEAEARIESSMLIIDVRETDSTQPALAPPTERGEMTAELPPPRPAAPSRMDELTNEGSAMTELEPPTSGGPMETAKDEPNAQEIQESPPIAAEEVAQKLIAQLNRAAEQGLVELADAEPQSIPEPPAQPDPPEPEDFLSPVEEDIDGLETMADRISRQLEQADIGASVSVRIPETVSQITRPGQAPELPLPQDENVAANENCIDPDLIDIRFWADDRPPAIQISELRGKVFGEFDEPDLNTALELVRLYLAHGFGLEAHALITDLGLTGYEAEVLAEFSAVIEGQPHIAGGHLDKAVGCDGGNDLWRAASTGTSETLPIPDPDEMIAYYAETPILVRRLLAPRLIEGFLVRGQFSEARSLLKILDRSPGTDSDAIKLARARLWHAEGQIQEAEAAYADLVQTGGAEAVDAAILLTESILSRGANIPALLVQDLEALAQIYRGTDLGQKLRLSEISAKAGSNRLDAALAIVSDEFGANFLPGSDVASATDEILRTATIDRFGEDQILASVFRFREIVTDDAISPEARLHLAQELVAAGLPNTALELLAIDQATISEEQMLVAARAEFLLDRPETVKEKLVGLTSANAARLRAEALTMEGQFNAAYSALSDAGVSDNIHEYAWRAGDWPVASDSNDEFIRDMANYMSIRENPPKPSERVLEDIGLANSAIAANEITTSVPGEITLDYVRETQERSQSTRLFITEAISTN